MDRQDGHPDDAVEVPGRRTTSQEDAHVAGIVRRAVAPPAPAADRVDRLTQAALRRAGRKRNRRLLAASAALTTAVTLTALGAGGAEGWSPRPVDHFTATTDPSPTASASPTLSMAPLPTATEQAASPLTYLTPSEVHAVFPDADSLDPNGEFQWSDVQGHTWFTACGADTSLGGVAPLHSLQIASWGQSTPQPPSQIDGQVSNLITSELNINMFIFTSEAEAQQFGQAFAASVSTCAADSAGEPDRLALEPSTPVEGTLDTDAASLFTYGFSQGTWPINALVVRGRYAAMTWAQVPAPEDDQGYVDAARATAGLAAIAAGRAAKSNLP